MSNIIKFWLTCQFSKIFIPNFVCTVQVKDTKHIRRDFYSVTLVMGICDGAPSTGGSSLFCGLKSLSTDMVETISKPYHTFPGQANMKQLTRTQWIYFCL